MTTCKVPTYLVKEGGVSKNMVFDNLEGARKLAEILACSVVKNKWHKEFIVVDFVTAHRFVKNDCNYEIVK